MLRRYAAGITTISSPTHALALAPITYEEKQWQPLGLVTIALVSIGLLLSAALLLLIAFHIAAGVRGDEDKDLLHHDDNWALTAAWLIVLAVTFYSSQLLVDSTSGASPRPATKTGKLYKTKAFKG